MTEEDLKNGMVFKFNNKTWCDNNGKDEYQKGYISINHFKRIIIMFNGSCLQATKSFTTTKMRLEKLFKDWHLEFIK